MPSNEFVELCRHNLVQRLQPALSTQLRLCGLCGLCGLEQASRPVTDGCWTGAAGVCVCVKVSSVKSLPHLLSHARLLCVAAF